SSRRRHTRFSRDWSSDVCSSDLNLDFMKIKSPSLIGVDISSSSVKMVELSKVGKGKGSFRVERYVIEPLAVHAMQDGSIVDLERSEERRVGKEWRLGWIEVSDDK